MPVTLQLAQNKKTPWLCVVLVLLGLGYTAGAVSRVTEKSIQDLMHQVNAYQRDHPYQDTDRNWIRAFQATQDPAYLKQALAWAEKHQWQVGTEGSGSNMLFCVLTWVQLYLLDPHPHPPAASMSHRISPSRPPRATPGISVSGGSGRPGTSHTIVSDNFFASTYTGIRIHPMARKTIGVRNEFDHVDEPIDDHGLRTVVQAGMTP